jgi:transcription termination factor Rho
MTSIPHLLQQSRAQLLALAAERGLGLRPHLAHDALVADLVTDMLVKGEPVTTDGILTVLPEGFGFVRIESQDFANTAVDAYVSGNQVHRLNLQVGQRIRGSIRAPRGTEKTFALVHVDLVQNTAPEDLLQVTSFTSRTTIAATRDLRLTAAGPEPSAALEDFHTTLAALQSLAPMRFGHRALLHAKANWPRARFLARLASSLQPQHPELQTTLCLLEQRPEDIANARLQLAESNCSLFSTTFAAPPERHVTVAELTLHRCLRQVEQGHDVLLLVDSLTALTRASSRTSSPSGAWIQPGLDAKAILPAKHVLACARQCAEGGSLTVIATVTTGAAGTIDAAIEQEFAALTNSDIVIDDEACGATDAVLPFDVLATRTRAEDHASTPSEQTMLDAMRSDLAALPMAERMARWREFHGQSNPGASSHGASSHGASSHDATP